MASDRRSGRPTETRQEIAGKQLGIALKILGKTWRKDTLSINHVHNWPEWNNLNLPRSATTIDKDIREGIPEGRIAAYAHCLGLHPSTLLNEQDDLFQTLLPDNPAIPSAAPLDYQRLLPEHYSRHNNEAYIKELSSLLHGVYRMSYVLQGIETLHRCTVWIQEARNDRIFAEARFIMFGLENHATVDIFRWHNNLHFHYLCDNRLELGYLMTVDPLRHNLVRKRDPFWLKGQGLTDRGSAQNPPITFTFLKERLAKPEQLSFAQLWEEECEQMRLCPHLRPVDPKYDLLRQKILAPDHLDVD